MTASLVEVDEARLGLTVSGSGPAVLLLPGGAGCSDYLAPVASRLDDLVTVHRLEPRGCGRSTADGRYDLETTLADLDAVREQRGLERWIVGGHSHGAFYALAYALRHPERVRAVLYLSGTGLQSDRSWRADYDAGREAGLDSQVPHGTFSVNQDVNAVGSAEYKRYVRRPDLWRSVAELRVPVRAVHGERDVRPVWPVEQLVALLPDARLRIVPDAPHDLWYTHPDALGAVMREDLLELLAGTPLADL